MESVNISPPTGVAVISLCIWQMTYFTQTIHIISSAMPEDFENNVSFTIGKNTIPYQVFKHQCSTKLISDQTMNSKFKFKPADLQHHNFDVVIDGTRCLLKNGIAHCIREK